MCTSLAKLFSCTKAPEEDRDLRDLREPPDCAIENRHKDQLLALSSLSADALAQRRRASRLKQPPPPLPPTKRPTLCCEQNSDGCNSYKAMERHDQILDENSEQL